MSNWVEKLEKIIAETKSDSNESSDRPFPTLMSEEKEELLGEIIDHLSDIYPRGLYDFLSSTSPDTYHRINDIEDRINLNMATGGTKDHMLLLLKDYWAIHLESIKQFEATGGARRLN